MGEKLTGSIKQHKKVTAQKKIVQQTLKLTLINTICEKTIP